MLNVGYMGTHIFPGLSNSKSMGTTSGAETTYLSSVPEFTLDL